MPTWAAKFEANFSRCFVLNCHGAPHIYLLYQIAAFHRYFMSHSLKLSPSLWCIKLVGNFQTFLPLAASHRSRERFLIADKISVRYEDEFNNKKQLDSFTILMLILQLTMMTTSATYKVLRKLLCMEALPLGCDGYQILRVAADLNIWQVGRKKWLALSIWSPFGHFNIWTY